MGYRGSFPAVAAAAFAALLAAAPSAHAASVVDGFVKVALAITVKSTVPAGAAVYCAVSLSGYDSAGTSVEASKTIAATRGSSATAYSCTVLVPYRWTIAGTSGTLSGSYTALIADATNRLSYDFSLDSIASFPMSASGAVTSISGALWL